PRSRGGSGRRPRPDATTVLRQLSPREAPPAGRTYQRVTLPAGPTLQAPPVDPSGPHPAGPGYRPLTQRVSKPHATRGPPQAGSCAVATSKVLAAVLRTLRPDLVLAGAESTDGRVQVMPQMLAERLGIAALTGARKLTVDGTSLTVERQTEEGYEVVTAATPAIVSVWDTINEPRYPSLKGIMAAKKKPVQTLSLADLGISPDEVGFAGSTSTVVESTKRPPRQAGTKVTDSGDGGVQLVEFLATERFV